MDSLWTNKRCKARRGVKQRPERPSEGGEGGRFKVVTVLESGSCRKQHLTLVMIRKELKG